MKDIPVEYEYKGVHYRGVLSYVHGTGAHSWHLMVDNYYHGQLVYVSSRDTFQFSNQDGYQMDLAEQFGRVVLAALG